MRKNLETGGEKPFNGKNTLVQPDSGREARTEQEQFSNQGELGTMQQQLALKSVEAVQKLLAQVFISCWLTTELKSGHTTGWLKLGLCAHKKQHSDHVKALLAIKKNPHDTFKCPRTAMECKICWATFPPSANFCLSERFSAEKC